MKVEGFEDYNEWVSKVLKDPNSTEACPDKCIQKRIFLLTDGEVRNPEEVVKQAGVLKDNTRVHTFGIGEGCDKFMVMETAESGRGSFSIVKDSSGQLNGQVV